MDLIVFTLTAFASYWYETEIFLFFGGLFLAARFLYFWYRPLLCAWPASRGLAGRLVLGLLPAAAFMIILFTLQTMASYDVVGFWVFFYIVLGYAWLLGGMHLLERFDLASACDAVYLDNKAALFPMVGGFIGVSLIYAGANIGDGPGWWVILIAGSLGFAVWFCLALLLGHCCGITERITVGRDMGCGIRFGAYLIASGLILARASGGDWTSLYYTVLEFTVGWPVLPLALFAFLAEKLISLALQDGYRNEAAGVLLSLLCAGLYLAFAYIALSLPPSVTVNLILKIREVMP